MTPKDEAAAFIAATLIASGVRELTDPSAIDWQRDDAQVKIREGIVRALALILEARPEVAP